MKENKKSTYVKEIYDSLNYNGVKKVNVINRTNMGSSKYMDNLSNILDTLNKNFEEEQELNYLINKMENNNDSK